ncbi:MAG: electron transport complex protein RnfC, partial [Thermodesulfobacteriota bacterium]
MIKKPFFGLAKPRLAYDALDPAMTAQEIPAPAAITLLVDAPFEKQSSLAVKAGDAVAKGQAVSPVAGSTEYATATL